MITPQIDTARNARTLHPGISIALDRTLQWSVAFAILAVPLIVLPESQFASITNLPKVALVRTLAAVIAITLSLKGTVYVIAAQQVAHTVDINGHGNHAGMLLRRPASWLLISAATVLLGTFISTALSIHLDSSLWGIDPGDSHRDLYTSAAYFVIFVGAALAARSAKIVRTLGIIIAISGTISAIVGAGQYLGFSPFGISGTYGERLTGTSGNPIFFGTILVLSLPFVVFPIARYGASNGYSAAYWGILIATSALFYFSSAGTASRAVFSGILLVTILILVGLKLEIGARKALLHTAALLTALAIAVSLNVIVPSNVKDTRDSIVTVASPDKAVTSALSRGRLDANYLNGTASTRLDTWSTTTKLIVERPQSPAWATTPGVLRHLFGYGPDSFRYTNQYAVPENGINRITSHAHNEFLNRWVELGLFGLAGWLLLWLTAVVAVVRLLLNARRSERPAFSSMAIFGSLAGIGFMHLSGVPQPGDTLLFWVVLGILAGMTATSFSPVGNAAAWQQFVRRGYLPPLAIVLAVVTVMLAFVLTWTQNAGIVQASAEAANGLRAADYDNATAKIERAAELAPNVVLYYDVLGQAQTERAESTASVGQSNRIRLQAFETYRRGLNERPFDRDLNFRTAQAAWSAAASGNGSLALEAIAIYENLKLIAPNDPLLAPRLEAMRAAIGVAER